MENKRIQGKVKWYSGKRGYGYITDEKGIDYFIHFADIISTKEFKIVFENDLVEFDPVMTAKGWRALNVKTILAPQEKELASANATGEGNDHKNR